MIAKVIMVAVFIALCAMVALGIKATSIQQADCEQSGGQLVRGVNGYICLKAK